MCALTDSVHFHYQTSYKDFFNSKSISLLFCRTGQRSSWMDRHTYNDSEFDIDEEYVCTLKNVKSFLPSFLPFLDVTNVLIKLIFFQPSITARKTVQKIFVSMCSYTHMRCAYLIYSNKSFYMLYVNKVPGWFALVSPGGERKSLLVLLCAFFFI